jgi:predicted PurR-regulated permease PerM
MGAALLLVMHQGILPGLLCVCVGFMLTRSLSRLLSRANPRAFASNQLPRWAQVVATTIVILAPLALLSGALSQTRTYITEAPAQYKELLDYLAATVLELREKLPRTLPISCLTAPRKFKASWPAIWPPRPACWPLQAAPGSPACSMPMWA